MNKTDEDLQRTSYDAIVIGSGATGSVAAWQLAAAGLRVLVLEGGPLVARRSDYGIAPANFAKGIGRHLMTKRQEVQKMHATYWTTNPDFFVDDIDHPYTTPADKPFRWIRGRQLGGRTLTWDGVVPRMSDYELKAASRDGIGTDWPLNHADLAPYYTKLERFFLVHGSTEGLSALPDGDFQSPCEFTPAEKIFKQRVEAKFKERRVIPSRGIAAGRTPARGQVHSGLSSLASSLHAATATGRVKIRTNAIVSEINVSSDGHQAESVTFIDAVSKQTEQVRAKMVFVCASTIETLRILLNSKSNAHPGGIGGSSGVLGHYVMDHIAGNTYFHMPEVKSDGVFHALTGSDSLMIPRFQNLDTKTSEHTRGFGLWGGIQRLPIPSPLLKKRGEAFGFLTARAEVLPHFDNQVSLDPVVKDAWGLAAPHIAVEWKEPELQIARAGRQASEEMIAAAGGRVANLLDLVYAPFVSGYLANLQKEWAPSTPGLFVHEVGGARMGDDAKTSVVDSVNRVWDVPNVFVTDGACWPSSGWQNPTLTEMAVTMRAVDHAVRALKS